MGWADQLIQEYTVGQLELAKTAERLDGRNPSDKYDLRHINSMIESMAFSMEWMATGRQPGTYRVKGFSPFLANSVSGGEISGINIYKGTVYW